MIKTQWCLKHLEAQLCAIQCGLLMGFIFYGRIYYMDAVQLWPEFDSFFDKMKFWPYLVIVAAATVTTAILYKIKSISNREGFYQFYLLIVGTLLFGLGGYLLVKKNGEAGVYVASVGHGITYVSILSYLNVSSSKYRSFLLAMPHATYLIGCAFAITFMQNQIFNVGFEHIAILRIIGLCFILFSIILFIILAVNDLLQSFKWINYKKSTDSVFNEYNKGGLIFLSRDELISEMRNICIQQFPGLQVQVHKQSHVTSLLWITLTKCQGVLLFTEFSILLASIDIDDNYNFYLNFKLTSYILALGATVGLLLLLVIQANYIFCFLTFAASVLLIYVLNVHSNSFLYIRICLAIIAFNASISDLTILNLATIKHSEVAILCGQIYHFILLAVSQHYFYANIRFQYHIVNSLFMGPVCAMIIVFIFGAIFIPNLRVRKTLIEIKMILLGIIFIKKPPVEIQTITIVEHNQPNQSTAVNNEQYERQAPYNVHFNKV